MGRSGSAAEGRGVNRLIVGGARLRVNRFRRIVVPRAVALAALFNLAVGLLVVLVFALADGVTPTVRWLEMIPIALGFIVLATGFGMMLSALYVSFRDIQPIWDVVLQIGFYGSPIIYVAANYDKFAAGFEHVALISPPATLLTQMGHAFIDPAAYPPAATAAGGWGPVIIAIALIPAVFALGWWVFTRAAPRVAEAL